MSETIEARCKIALKDPHCEWGNVLLEESLGITITSTSSGKKEWFLNLEEAAAKFKINLQTKTGELRVEALQRLVRELTFREYKLFKKQYDATDSEAFE